MTFTDDVKRLSSGTAAAQVIAILGALVIARLFDPSEFGVYAIFVAIIASLSPLVSLRYDLAVPLASDDQEADSLFTLSLMLAAIFAMAAGIVVVALNFLNLESMTAETEAMVLWIPPALFLSGGLSALGYWMARRTRFGWIAASRVSQQVGLVAVAVALAILVSPTALALVLANLAGLVLGLLVLLVGALGRRRSRPHLIKGLREVRTAARTHRDFPRYDVWSALMNTLSVQAPTLLLGTLYSSTIVGFYAAGQRVLGAPMSFVGSAVGQVFYPYAARLRDAPAEVADRFRALVITLSRFAVVPFLTVALVGPALFSVVLGPDWREAGVYAQILAPWLLLQLLASPVSTLFLVYSKLRALLILNVTLLITRLASIVTGALMGGPLLSLALFSASGIAFYIAMLTYLSRQIGSSPVVLAKGIVSRNWISALGVAVTLTLATVTGMNDVAVTALATVIVTARLIFVHRHLSQEPAEAS